MIAHDVLTLLCARSLGFPGMEVPVTPYRRDSCGGYPYNEAYLAKLAEGEPSITWPPAVIKAKTELFSPTIDYRNLRRGKGAASVPARVPADELLSLHSVEPDWGMDEGLSLSPLQALTGGSQGYRHLRYGLFFFRVGVPHRRACLFHRCAEAAFRERDRYWGIRFSAWVIHFIEDITTPVHAKPFTEGFLFTRIIRARGLFHTAMNYHLNFERLVGMKLEQGDKTLVGAVLSAPPARITSLERDLLRFSRKARGYFPPIFRECRSLWGESMRGGPVDLPESELRAVNLSSGLEEVLERSIALSSSAVKGYIKEWVLPHLAGSAPKGALCSSGSRGGGV